MFLKSAMQAALNRKSWLAIVLLPACFAGSTLSHAKEQEPTDVLKNQGLKRSPGAIAIWVVAGEAGFLKAVRRAQNLSVQLRMAQQQQQALELGNQNPQVLINNYREQIDWLGQRIDAYDNELARQGPAIGNQAATVYHNMLVNERNALVTEQNRLRRVINQLADQRGQFQDMKQQFNAEVAKVRESYMQAVDDLRKSVDDITAKYAELSKNEEVTKALKALSARTKQKLGPSKECTAAINWLRRFEGSVQSDTVELHREGGVDHVDVMLNGRGPVRMVFDTGAGPTALSAELASRMNLKPTGRTMELVVADGAKVTAKVMIIRTVTLGRLTVKDVTCVVMPKDKGDVEPLLGQSILQRFDYKYTQGAGRLVLNKVEPDEPAVPPGKGKGSKKKR
ncbi:MAG: TIGR02281 family clan AA aspartic protease [Isosphaeraceae bacterium]